MFPELQKPRVTEIQVRMDCNGCVQKMKKTLNGINGIYDHYIDFPQQKITVVGWADPERIIKAIKKTRKTATICSHTEPTEFPSQPTEPEPEPEPEPEGNAPAPDPPQQLSEEAPPAQAATQAEPPPEQPPPEAPTPTENNASLQSQSNPGTKDVGQVHEKYHYPPNYANRFGSGHSYVGHGDRYHLITPGTKDVGQVHEKYHYPPNYANRFSSGHSYVGHGDRYHNSPVFLQEPPPPIYVTHSYNSYKPSPYVTEYEYARSPPRHTHHNRMEYYSGDYQNRNGNITSIFSDENPNACRIV